MRTMSFVDRCFAATVSAKKVYCDESSAFSAGYRVVLAVGEYAAGRDGLGWGFGPWRRGFLKQRKPSCG